MLNALQELLRDKAAVTSIVADRIYYMVAPQNATLPFVLLHRESVSRDSILAPGYSGVVQTTAVIRSYATTWNGAYALSEAIRQAINGQDFHTQYSRPMFSINLQDESDVLEHDEGAETSTIAVASVYTILHTET